MVVSVPDLCAVEWGSNPIQGVCSRYPFWALILISMPMVNVTHCYDGALLIMLRSQYPLNSSNCVIEAFIKNWR